MITDKQIIAIRKATQAKTFVSWAETLAFARALLEEVWYSVHLAPENHTVRIPEQDGFKYAFYDGFYWWYHDEAELSYAVGPTPAGWRPE